MSCRHGKFDSQKLILLRTFNWCATQVTTGTYQRWDDQTDGYLTVCSFMRITWHGMAKCGTLEGTWNDTNSSTKGSENTLNYHKRGKAVGFEEAQDVSTTNILCFYPRYRR